MADSLTEFETRRRSCAKEPETLDWIRDYLRPGDVVYDIGANVGAYSLVIDRLYSGQVKVCAFEPSYTNFCQLCRNIALNRSKSIQAYPLALGKEAELVNFELSSLETGAARHRFAAPEAQNTGVFQMHVVALSLDQFVRDFGAPIPTHVKLDVDGPELQVIAGGRSVLSQVASVIVEFDQEPGTADAITSALQNCGLRVSSISSRFYRCGVGNAVFSRRLK